MGASTAILVASKNKFNIKVICIDSAFSSIKKVVRETMEKYKIIDKLFGDIIFKKIRANMKARVGFDLM